MTDQPSEAITPEGRYLRGAFGMGLAWAVGCAIGVPLSDVFDAVFLGGTAQNLLGEAFWGAIIGFVAGGVFSVALAVAGRRRRFDEMSLPLFAALGAVVPSLMLMTMGVLLGEIGYFLTPRGLVNGTFLALMGAGFSAGTLALARKAEDRELLDAGADVADIGLTKEEKRELLGR